MTFATQFALLAVSTTVSAGSGPTGPPTDGFTETFGGPPARFRVRWTNGDATAYTRIYDGAVAPANLIGTVNPGITSFNTSITDDNSGTFRLTHYKNGAESAADAVPYGQV